MIDKNNLAGDIRRIRKKRGLTQKQLGELCGINEVQIRRYELGNANPKIETIQKIARALQCQINVPDDLRILEDVSVADNPGFLESDGKWMKGDKAVLLVNMPARCKDCELFCDFQYTGRCILNFEPTEKDKKPDWCPLVPLPKKKELSCEDQDYDTKASAWNSCIDAITGVRKLRERLQIKD